MWYWNTSAKEWQRERYMVKEHSVVCGPRRNWLATVVVIPAPCKDKAGKPKIDKETGEVKLSFIPMGVRIELLDTRKVLGECEIPGFTMFVKFKTNLVTDTPAWTLEGNRVGPVLDCHGRPIPVKPVKGRGFESVPVEKHCLPTFVAVAVEMAVASYEAYKEAKRERKAA